MPKFLDLKMGITQMEQKHRLVVISHQCRISVFWSSLQPASNITAIKHAVFPLGSPFGSVKNPIDFLPQSLSHEIFCIPRFAKVYPKIFANFWPRESFSFSRKFRIK